MSLRVYQPLYFVLVLGLFMLPVQASSEQTFEVKSASTQRNETVFFLNAVFDIQLPHYIAEAFEQGFDLPLIMEIEVYRSRTMWLDKQVVYIKQQYRLQNNPLLDAVSLFNINRGNHLYFNSLSEAIRHLTVLFDYPMLDRNNLVAGKNYWARLRFAIDSNEIPIPLKSSSLWENDWDLSSDWFEWDIGDE